MHIENEQSRQVREICTLWREWDPIGVYTGPDSGCPPDEYDNYLAPCLRLLEQHASTEDLAKYLSYIVGEYMSLGTTELVCSQSVEFAGKLQQWYASAWQRTQV
jgi:hypothetical protein